MNDKKHKRRQGRYERERWFDHQQTVADLILAAKKGVATRWCDIEKKNVLIEIKRRYR